MTKNTAKHHQVFFRFLSMPKVANRKKLKHWAVIQSVSNFACGATKSAKTVFAYFGPNLAYTTQHHVMARLMWSDLEYIMIRSMSSLAAMSMPSSDSSHLATSEQKLTKTNVLPLGFSFKYFTSDGNASRLMRASTWKLTLIYLC